MLNGLYTMAKKDLSLDARMDSAYENQEV